MIIIVITSSTSCYTTSSNLKVDLQLPANRALQLRVDVRSWCSTSANDKWRSTVSEKTRYRKLFTLCALKHFNRAVFGPLKSQRNVFLRTTMHHSSDDAVFLHQCLNRSSYLSEFIQFSDADREKISRRPSEIRQGSDLCGVMLTEAFVNWVKWSYLCPKLFTLFEPSGMHKTRVHFNRDSRWGARHPFTRIH